MNGLGPAHGAAGAAGGVLCGLALALSLPLLNNGRGPAPLAIATGKAPVTTVQTADRASANGQSRLTLTPRDGVGPYRITPERRALLNTIRFAEGTWTGGRHDGYRMLYGGRLIADLTRHPEILVRSRYNSAAAGAYQFLPRTWEEAARMLRLPDFGPTSQDQAALYLVERRGVLQRFDRQGLCHEVLARLAPEWASLPTNSGQSYYGQPVQDARVLLRFYSAQLARERAAAPGPGQSA